MKGVMIGLMEDDQGRQGIGITIAPHPTIIVSIGYAGMLWGQIGDILDDVGYFDDDDDGDDEDSDGSVH